MGGRGVLRRAGGWKMCSNTRVPTEGLGKAGSFEILVFPASLIVPHPALPPASCYCLSF